MTADPSADPSAAIRRPEVLRLFLDAAEERLRAAPRDAMVRWAKAQKLRELGDHAAAAAAYDAYCEVRPEDARGRALARLMRGDPDGAALRGGAAPFLRIDDFLAPADLAALWDRVAAHRSRLAASRVANEGGSRVDPTHRASQACRADSHLRAFLLPRMQAAMAAGGLPGRLALPDLAGGEIEMEVTSHGDQEFFRIHRDCGPAAPRRALTYLCYLTRPTTRYDGGDLLLFDEDGSSFTRIRPAGNRLLFFPSDRRHEVTLVTCDAADPLDARLSVNGWFHRPAASPGATPGATKDASSGAG